jgi:gluconolactonase
VFCAPRKGLHRSWAPLARAMTSTVPYLISLTLTVGVVRGQNSPLKQAFIRGVIAADARVELVRGGFQAFEGPVATPDGGLYLSDLDQNRTYKLDASGAVSVWRENTKRANGLFSLRNSQLLVAEGGGARIISVTPELQITPLATECCGKPLRAPNDLIPDRKGGIYFTDPGPRYPPNVAPTKRRNVCYIRPNGEVLLLDNQMVYPNGITLSLDQKTLFVDNSFGEYVHAFEVEPDGRVKNKRPFVKLREPEQWPPWGCGVVPTEWHSIQKGDCT